jgi:thiol-disulfide isomerase/thioredoxin
MFRRQLTLLGTFLLATFSSSGQQVIIKGVFKNTPDPLIIANIPIDGRQFKGANVRIVIDTASGVFRQAIDIKKPGFLTLTNNWNQVRFFVTPGQTYTIRADSGQYTVIGDQQAGQDMIKTFGFLDDSRKAAAALSKLPSAEARIDAARAAADQKKAAVASLFREGQISETFRQALNSAIDLNYISTLSENFFFTFREKEDQPEAVEQFRKNYLPQWKKIYENAPPFSQLLYAPDYSWMLIFYNNYRKIADSGKLVYNRGMYAMQEIDSYKTHLEGPALEYAWANIIVSGIGNNEYEKEWIDIFKAFRQQFPNSPLTPYLNKEVQKVVAYYNADKHPDKEVKFLPNYDKLSQFSEVTAALKGRVTYIDLWATWCSPCREELQYSMELHEALQKLGVQAAYLSIDSENADGKWKEMARRLPLKGIHLRSNKSLHEDLARVVPQFVGIPRYIILDKNGNVAVWDAKRPSDKLALIRQLKQYL